MATNYRNDELVLGLPSCMDVRRPTIEDEVSHERVTRANSETGHFTSIDNPYQGNISFPSSPSPDQGHLIKHGDSHVSHTVNTLPPGVWTTNHGFTRRDRSGNTIDPITSFISMPLMVDPHAGAGRRKSKAKKEKLKQQQQLELKDSFALQGDCDHVAKPEIRKPPQVFVCLSPVPEALYVIPNCKQQFVTTAELSSFDYETVEPGSYIGSESGYGYYCVSQREQDNVKNCVVRPATMVVHMEAFRFKDDKDLWVEYPAQKYRVFEPLFVKLNSQFRAAHITESILNAITVHSTLEYGEHPILTETLAYYRQLVTRRYYAQIQNTNLQRVVMNNANLIAKGDSGVPDILDTTLLVNDKYDAWRIYDVDCNLPLTWEVRNDFDIISQKKVDKINEAGDVDDTGLYYRFSQAKIKPRYRTAFFKLEGVGIPEFVEYGNTAHNLTHGLKRLFGRKNGELQLRQNAILLGAHIAKECAGLMDANPRQIFHDLVGSQRKRGPYADVYNTACMLLSDQVESIDLVKKMPGYDLRCRVAKWYSQVWLECTRTKIQQFVDALSTAGHWSYYYLYKQCLTKLACCFSRQAIAQIRHVKQRLRMRYVQGALLSDQDDLLVRELNVLIKRELGKFGKAPRLYVSYDAGCVYANELPEFCKVGIDGKHTFVDSIKTGPLAGQDLTITINIMAKPKQSSLPDIFDELYQAMLTPNHIYAAIYSDDMCLSGNLNGKRFSMNLDMESNDSSQDVPAFLAATLCMSNFSKTKALGLVKQCMLPLRVCSPEDPDSYMKVQMHGPLEGSGSTLTTLLNHLGSLLVILSIFSLLLQEENYSDLDTLFKEGARVVGHTVTVDDNFATGVCNFHNTQFLKRSPFYNKGRWLPYMNLGCILRSLGTVEDDLTEVQLNIPHSLFCSLTNEERITRFTTAVVNGWKYEPTNPILRALRARFSSVTDEVKVHDSLTFVFDADKPIDYSHLDNTDAIIARYGLTECEIDELARVISSIRIGQTIRTTAYSKIMAVDYGVKYVEEI